MRALMRLLAASLLLVGCGGVAGGGGGDVGTDDALFRCSRSRTDIMNNPCYGPLPEGPMTVTDVCLRETYGPPGDRYTVVDAEWGGGLKPHPEESGVEIFSFTATITQDVFRDWTLLPGTDEVYCLGMGYWNFAKPDGSALPDECDTVMSVDRICRCRGRTTTSYRDVRVLHGERGVIEYQNVPGSGTLESSCFVENEGWIVGAPFSRTTGIGNIHLILRSTQASD